jgi:hypothetical protein
MHRALAIALTLGALWSLYRIGMMCFIVSYSGSDPELTGLDWFELAIQSAINVFAIILVWRVAPRVASSQAAR